MAYDPESMLPAALRRDVAEVNAAFEAAAAAEAEAGQTATDDESVILDEQASEGAAGDENAQETTTQSTDDASATEESVIPDAGFKETATGQSVTPGSAELETANLRYKTLQGKYNKEIPRLSTQVKLEQERNTQLAAENKQLKEQLATLQAGGAAAAGEQAGSGTQAHADAGTNQDQNQNLSLRERYELTDEEAEYGDEMISLQEKIARKVAQGEQARIKAEQQAQQQQQGQQQLVSELTQLCPDWRAINASEAFLAFCDQVVDDRIGIKWQKVLDEKLATGDAAQIVTVFDAFKESKRTGRQPSRTANATIDEQVMPSTTQGDGPQAVGKRIYTLEQYSQLMDDITRGRITGERAQKVDAELRVAFREGRIRD